MTIFRMENIADVTNVQKLEILWLGKDAATSATMEISKVKDLFRVFT